MLWHVQNFAEAFKNMGAENNSHAPTNITSTKQNIYAL